MRTAVRPRTLVALLCLAGLLLAGCSDPGQPSTTLPTAAGPTSSTTSTGEGLPALGPAGFPVPDAARQQTPDGVLAMATYWLDLADYVTANPGTIPAAAAGPLRDLSSPDCEYCTDFADAIEAVAAAGQHLEGGDLAIAELGSVTAEADQGNVVWLVQEQPGRLVGSDGTEVRSSDGQQLDGGIDLTWDSARSAWIATQVTLTPRP